MPPASSSERTSSLVKKRLPFVDSKSRSTRRGESSEPPTSVSTNERCSEGVNGPERDVAEAAIAAEAVEHARERVAIVHLGRAVAADDQRRRRTEAGHDVRERLDRGLGPVQVLEEQHERPAAGDPRQRAREQLEDLRLVLERGRRLPLALVRRPSRRSGSRGSRAASGTASAGRPRGPRSRAAARSPCPSPGSAPGRSRRSPGTRRRGRGRRSGRAAPGSVARSRASRARPAAASCRSPARRPPPRTGDSPASAAFSRRCSSANSFARPTKGASTGRGVVSVSPVSGRSRSLSRSRER